MQIEKHLSRVLLCGRIEMNLRDLIYSQQSSQPFIENALEIENYSSIQDSISNDESATDGSTDTNAVTLASSRKR